MNGNGPVIITAAGASRRMGGIKKEYCPLPVSAGQGDEKPLTVLGAVVKAFASSTRIGLIIITIPEGGENEARSALPPNLETGKKLLFATGGPTSRSSVHNALSLLKKYHPSWVLIHDGARPWITTDLIEKIIDAVLLYGAAIPLLPLLETPKEFNSWRGIHTPLQGGGTDSRREIHTPSLQGGDADFSAPGGTGFITRHLKRTNVGIAQTPQGFSFPGILKAHEKAAERELKEKIDYTDDAEVWGEFIGPVAVIPGETANRKITFPEDLEFHA